MHKFKYDIEKETGIPWKKKKSYRYLYTLACQKGVILRAFKRMKRGKSDRKDIQMVEEDLDGWVEKIQKIIQNTKPAGICYCKIRNWNLNHQSITRLL